MVKRPGEQNGNDEALIEAAKVGDVAKANAALDAGAKIDEPTPPAQPTRMHI